MGIKVYYLDDEPMLGELFIDQFSIEEIEIISFTNYNQLQEKISKEKPDLILVDYRLPGINGETVAQKIGLEIPIVLLTGEINIKTTYPFKQILTKPYNSNLIVSLLQTILKQSKK